MEVFEIPEELTDELRMEVGSSKEIENLKPKVSSIQGTLSSIRTKLDKYVYEYCKKIFDEKNKDETKYKIEYVYKKIELDDLPESAEVTRPRVITKYDIENRDEIINIKDAFQTIILCMSDSNSRIFLCDIDTNKYKYKLFDNEEFSILKVKKNKVIELKKCYGIIFLEEVEILIINIIDNMKDSYGNIINTKINEWNEVKMNKLSIKKEDVYEECMEMNITKDFYKDFLYKKVCCEELYNIISNTVYNLRINNEKKNNTTKDNIMEKLIDEEGYPISKYLQRFHVKDVIQKNVCKYFLSEFTETKQIELLMDNIPNLIQLFSCYFEDLYEEIKKKYNIHNDNVINMKNLKIMKTNKIEINKVELICLIPLEEITIDTSDSMKYIMNIGDLMIYYGEELVLDKEIIIITYTLSINDV